MRLEHNSRKTSFRAPYGAVCLGTTVTLRVRLLDADSDSTSVNLRLWVDGKGEQILPMEHVGRNVFSRDIVCDEQQIIWYSFHAAGPGGTCHLGAAQGRVGGEGVCYDYLEVPSFQITVYKHRETRPQWYEHGLVYQIFPDRYRRDDQWRERTVREVNRPRKGAAKRIVWDWDTAPTYERAEDGSIRTWDFYGGSLEGIRQDLPRLEEMGVTAIYLNPIFEATSNHRYDTADYLAIDPILGTEEDFERLCQDAQRHGIGIILDGVFNHTGDDSRYFNRYGNYPDKGAWNNPESPWHDAYHFHDDGTYDAWWGITNMPALNEKCTSVQDLILGQDGVIRKWLRAGARGWRLDVADELSDELIENIKSALIEEVPDGLLLGEVWEDASNKISYGKLRRYLLGDELDSAMNYPFRDMVLGYLLGGCDAGDAAESIEAIRENYPPEALACALNLLGSHDKPRIASVLGDGPDESKLPESERGRFRLDENSMGRAKGRFWLATLLQMTLPGVPCVYYGDEFALEGLSDPGNRRTLPALEDIRDHDMQTMIRNAYGLRRSLPFLVDGTLEASALNSDVLCIRRRSADGEVATILTNRSLSRARAVRVPIENEVAVDLLSGADLAREADGCCEVRLWPQGSSVVYSTREARLQKPLQYGAGVVCHITSVPTDDGMPGTLGAPAKRFVDHLAAMGMRYWQVLPVNPTDAYGSPYAGPSAFAGAAQLLPESEHELQQEFREFRKLGGASSTEYDAFCLNNSYWLPEWAAYAAIKQEMRGASRHAWPYEYSRYRADLCRDARLEERISYQEFIQFRFDQEWKGLRDYANARGIKIVGDIPMYVSDDSADAWAHPAYFNLDEHGRPKEIAGVPPDRFSATGQVWGNPTYNWPAIKEDGYRWWVERLRRSFDLYDYVRLDHFLGFESYYAIPQGKTGADGRWLKGPGIELFETAARELGVLPCIAEDLGIITPAVRALMAQCGFPGMDVLEFQDNDIRQDIAVHKNKVLYTSTHDTTTLKGFVKAAFCADGQDQEAGYLASEIARHALLSDAGLVMMQLQDLLSLGDEGRMNTPGTAEGNWKWQALETDIVNVEQRIAATMMETKRFNGPKNPCES